MRYGNLMPNTRKPKLKEYVVYVHIVGEGRIYVDAKNKAEAIKNVKKDIIEDEKLDWWEVNKKAPMSVKEI